MMEARIRRGEVNASILPRLWIKFAAGGLADDRDQLRETRRSSQPRVPIGIKDPGVYQKPASGPVTVVGCGLASTVSAPSGSPCTARLAHLAVGGLRRPG